MIFTTMKTVPQVTRIANLGKALINNSRRQIHTAVAASAGYQTSLSFVSPESDWCGSHAAINQSSIGTRYFSSLLSSAAGTHLSFASPESDFCTEAVHKPMKNAETHFSSAAMWSNQLSFASAEHDFCGEAAQSPVHLASASLSSAALWSNQLSFTSPENDFCAQATRSPVQHARANLSSADLWSNRLSFASPESDFSSDMINVRQATARSLPQTLEEVLQFEDDNAAIVVTTAADPHRIVHVNHAWESLCGFEKKEAVEGTLSLIQGTDTNTELAEATVQRLLSEYKPVDMYLVNYKKTGEKFINHVSMGPMTLNKDSSEVEYLVGILEEVREEDVPLRMAM